MVLVARAYGGPTALAPEVVVVLSSAVAPVRAVAAPEPADVMRLVERCRAGERDALGQLYRRFRPDAMRYIRHAVRNGQDAEDILQEVFLEVAHSIRSYAGRSSFEAWLRCICVRTALRHMKRRYRQVGEDESLAEGAAPIVAAEAEDPGQGYERRERARRIQRLLERIAPKKRMVLLLHDFEGVSPKEISQLVGSPVLTVRTRLFYARKELAALAAEDPVLATDLQPWLEAREEAR